MLIFEQYLSGRGGGKPSASSHATGPVHAHAHAFPFRATRLVAPPGASSAQFMSSIRPLSRQNLKLTDKFIELISWCEMRQESFLPALPQHSRRIVNREKELFPFEELCHSPKRNFRHELAKVKCFYPLFVRVLEEAICDSSVRGADSDINLSFNCFFCDRENFDARTGEFLVAIFLRMLFIRFHNVNPVRKFLQEIANDFVIRPGKFVPNSRRIT